MVGRLDGKIAIVTGGSRGQGEATARLFVAEGAKVIVADVLEEAGRQLAHDLGNDAVFHRLDISREDDWRALVDDAVARWGTIDVLINNAGIAQFSALLDLERSDFERLLAVNVIGSWLGMKSVVPVMLKRGRGSIVNVVSSMAMVGVNGIGAYMTSKWALRGLNKTAALEFGHRGIRVNGVFPGPINTPMSNSGSTEDLNGFYITQPIQRIGEPIEVASLNLFLASDESSYLCGSEIAVDGGQTIGAYIPFLPGAPENLTARTAK